MDKKVKMLLVAIGIALLVAIAATSYAFFTISNKEGNITNITSATMGIEYDDGDEIIANYLIPGDHVDKTFRVRNTGSYPLKYDVFLDEVYNNFVDQTDLVYELISNDGGYNTSSQIQAPNATTKIVDGQALPISTTHTYTLRITFLNKDENQDDNQGKSFRAKIRINTYQDAPDNGSSGNDDSNDINDVGCPGENCKYLFTTDEISYGDTDNRLSVEQLALLKNNYEEVVSTTGKNYFLGVIMNPTITNKVDRVFACGIKGEAPNYGTMFCIEGTEDGSKYIDNRDTLLSIYGTYDDERYTGCNEESNQIFCDGALLENSNTIGTYANSDGEANISVNNGYGCSCDNFGSAQCRVY